MTWRTSRACLSATRRWRAPARPSGQVTKFVRSTGWAGSSRSAARRTSSWPMAPTVSSRAGSSRRARAGRATSRSASPSPPSSWPRLRAGSTSGRERWRCGTATRHGWITEGGGRPWLPAGRTARSSWPCRSGCWTRARTRRCSTRSSRPSSRWTCPCRGPTSGASGRRRSPRTARTSCWSGRTREGSTARASAARACSSTLLASRFTRPPARLPWPGTARTTWWSGAAAEQSWERGLAPWGPPLRPRPSRSRRRPATTCPAWPLVAPTTLLYGRTVAPASRRSGPHESPRAGPSAMLRGS